MVMINTDDGQAVAPDMQVHYAKWRSWEQALREEVAPKLRSAADQLRDNIGLQTEGKWSTESGPQAFATKYKESTSPKRSQPLRRWPTTPKSSLNRSAQR